MDYDLNDEFIDDLVEKELQALNIDEESELNTTEIDHLDDEDTDYYKNVQGDFTESLKLFLENSNRRKLNADLILGDADLFLQEANEVINSSRLSVKNFNPIKDVDIQNESDDIGIDCAADAAALDEGEAHVHANKLNKSTDTLPVKQIETKFENNQQDLLLDLTSLQIKEELKIDNGNNFPENNSITAESVLNFFNEEDSAVDDIEDSVGNEEVVQSLSTPKEVAPTVVKNHLRKIEETFFAKTQSPPEDTFYPPSTNLEEDLARIEQLMTDITMERKNVSQTIEHDKQTKAAVVIQSHIRGFTCRYQYKKKLKEHFAITKQKEEDEKNTAIALETSDRIISEPAATHEAKESDTNTPKSPKSPLVSQHFKEYNETIINSDSNTIGQQGNENSELSHVQNGIKLDESLVNTKSSMNTDNDDSPINDGSEIHQQPSEHLSKFEEDGRVGEKIMQVGEESKIGEGQDVSKTVEVSGIDSNNKEHVVCADDTQGIVKKCESVRAVDNGENEIVFIAHESDQKGGICETISASNNSNIQYENTLLPPSNKTTNEEKNDKNEEVDSFKFFKITKVSDFVATNKSTSLEQAMSPGKDLEQSCVDQVVNENLSEDTQSADLNKDNELPNNIELAIKQDKECKLESPGKDNNDVFPDIYVVSKSPDTPDSNIFSNSSSMKEDVSTELSNHIPAPTSESVTFDLTKYLEQSYEAKYKNWLEMQNSDPQSEYHSKPMVVKNVPRRMIRKSSAAKRLQTFSEEELLHGAVQFEENKTDTNSIEILHLCGTEISRNITSVTRCVSLTHLSLVKCGLVSVEGLQNCPVLKYIDLSHNNVTVLSCVSMRRLEAFIARNNKLTSIHGMDGCPSLLTVDFSHNNITKISGLTDALQLKELRISHNQIMDVKEVSNNLNLIYIDVSNNHLLDLKTLKSLPHLSVLLCAHNNLNDESFACLSNNVVLTELNASNNNITSFDFMQDKWLPNLLKLDLSRNTITLSSQTKYLFSCVCPMLVTIDLSDNLFSSKDGILELFQGLENLNTIKIKNVIPIEDVKTTLEMDLLPASLIVEDDEKPSNSPVQYFNTLHDLCTQISPSINLPNYLSNMRRIMLELKRLLLKQNKELLRSYMRWPQSLRNKFTTPMHCISTHCAHLKELHTLLTQQRDRIIGKNLSLTQTQRLHEPERASIIAERREKKQESNLKCTNEEHNLNTVDDIRHSVAIDKVYSTIEKEKNRKKNEHSAACKLQALYRGYRARRVVHKIIYTRNASAIKIQSLWRGYIVRKKLKGVLEMCNIKMSKNDFSMDDEEFCLNDLEFNEEEFDKQWSYTVQDTVIKHENFHDEIVQNNFMKPKENIRPTPFFEKPPLPPTSPKPAFDLSLASESEFSHTSKVTKKQENLTNEWGIKSSSTAELMLKRARRMKGSRKKQMNANQKLKHFQEIANNNSVVYTPPKSNRSNNSKMAYKFQEYDYPGEVVSMQSNSQQMKEERSSFTYEWLHAPANNSSRSKPIQSTSSAPGFLPLIPRSPSLVAAQDLEVVSLSSKNSSASRKDVLRGIAMRHDKTRTKPK